MKRREFLRMGAGAVGSLFLNNSFAKPAEFTTLLKNRIIDVNSLLLSNHNLENNPTYIIIDGHRQNLYLMKYMGNSLNVKSIYDISTSRYGFGNKKGKNTTPIGVHEIKYKIGEDTLANTIFEGRVETNKIATINSNLDKDLITSRILWLNGLDNPNDFNTNYYSDSRFIYIHGTNNERDIGKPVSEGCIRMRNQEIITLFNEIPNKSLVYITKNLEEKIT